MALHTYSRTFTVAISGTTGSVDLENWDTLGLIVPTLDSTTLQIKVSMDNATWFIVKDGAGTQVLSYAASTGAFAVAARDMVDVCSYRYLMVVCGSAQNSAARTFTLCFDAPKRQ